MMRGIATLVADVQTLSQAAVEGKLATRADASKHSGEYRKMVEGINRTLDAVVGPLSVAGEYVNRISKGDLPPQISDTYHGDFNVIKQNLNQCIAALAGLMEEIRHMSHEHDLGDIDVVIDAGKFTAFTRRSPPVLTRWSAATSALRKKPWPASPSSAAETSTRHWRNFPARRPSSTKTLSSCAPT